MNVLIRKLTEIYMIWMPIRILLFLNTLRRELLSLLLLIKQIVLLYPQNMHTPWVTALVIFKIIGISLKSTTIFKEDLYGIGWINRFGKPTIKVSDFMPMEEIMERTCLQTIVF